MTIATKFLPYGKKKMDLIATGKKLAYTFDIILEYLADDTGKLTDIKDKAILQRILEIEKLDQEDKKTIDSLLMDAKAIKNYAA